jgi:hypothetical protein
MLRIASTATLVLGFAAAAAGTAAISQAPPAPSVDDSKIVCKYVVAPGAEPYRKCMSKGDWALKQTKDSKDANRIVCHYEDVPGSRLKGQKICQPASAWAEDQRVAREATERVQMGARAPH